ncbi:MAG: DUF362 domain-containing protein [Desulfocapsaceae bacterium]|nr:DUF362 domain-containing protein [Desulfocapsaceae bacterium]
MRENVYYIEASDNENDEVLCEKLQSLIQAEDLLGFVADKDIAAVKTHFGESPDLGFARPLYLKMLGREIQARGGAPFLTETSTLYKGNRDNAIKHIAHAQAQGFDFAATGMPIIMADGLFGDEEYDVPINGKFYKSVHVAALLAKCNALVALSHFTGHLAAGFGATLKNLGMGCASRKGKMEQHSTSKPKINKKKCTGCGVCADWCPQDAISVDDGQAAIDAEKCIGCGECLAMCRFDAVKYNWGATYEDLQKKIVEHAWGVHSLLRGKSLYINLLTRISKDCDCMGHSFKKIVPDIGIVISRDPVAVDAASLDLVEKRAGKTIQQLAYDIPYRVQLEYAKELKFGSPDYTLINV